MYWKHNNRLANDPKKVLPVSTAHVCCHYVPVRIQRVSWVYFDDQLIPVFNCFPWGLQIISKSQRANAIGSSN